MKPIRGVTFVPLATLIVAVCFTLWVIPAQAQSQGALRAHAPATNDGGGAAQLAPTTGTVVETFDSGGYTYLQVDDGSKKLWAAGPQTKVEKGNKVMLADGMPMVNFASKTLGRSFDLIYFVSAIQVVDGKADDAMAAAHSGAARHGADASAAGAVDLSNIKKADGGHTVAQLFSDKSALAGKEVAVRGRVVKYTAAVMGKNWVHIRDGSGSDGTNDLTVSTSADAAVGNLVLVRGKLQTDRDLGAGYHYDVIIEDAALTVE